MTKGSYYFPGSRRSDSLSIKPPTEEIEEVDNNHFHLEINWENDMDDSKIDNCWTFITNIQHNNLSLDSKAERFFYNPDKNHSIEPAKFLSYLKLDEGYEHIFQNYNPRESHFHYPLDSMIKLIPFQRLSKLRWVTALEERIKNNVNNSAERLGFHSNGDGSFITPNRRTISRFYYDYLGLKGHRRLFDILLTKLKTEMERENIFLGKKVGVDSMPLETLPNDPVGSFNAHYSKGYSLGKMIKVHIAVCLDTGIPLAVKISGANEYDGNYLIPLLKKIKKLNFNFKEIYGDNHYGNLKNWAIVPLMFDVKCYFNLAKGTIFREDGTFENIQKVYQKMWKNYDFENQDNLAIKDLLNYLLKHEKYGCVGAYHRNQFWKIREKNKHIYEYIKSRRNLCESLHGIMKEQLDMDKHLSGKGWGKIEIYVLQFLITMVVVALIRIENGIKEGFTRVSEGVFS